MNRGLGISVLLADTSAGPMERAGFIDAPLIGLDHRPASAM